MDAELTTGVGPSNDLEESRSSGLIGGTLRLRSDRFPWMQIEDEIVALDTTTSQYLSANPSAALLWHALVAGATRDDLVGSLVYRYAIDAATAGADVDRFLEALDRRGLIER